MTKAKRIEIQDPTEDVIGKIVESIAKKVKFNFNVNVDYGKRRVKSGGSPKKIPVETEIDFSEPHQKLANKRLTSFKRMSKYDLKWMVNDKKMKMKKLLNRAVDEIGFEKVAGELGWSYDFLAYILSSSNHFLPMEIFLSLITICGVKFKID